MPGKKIVLFVIILFGFFALYAIQRDGSEVQGDVEYENGRLYTVEYVAAALPGLIPIGDDQAVSRGMAAKMLAMAFKSTGEIHSLRRAHPFGDVAGYHWHEPYVNAVYTLGIMRGDGRRFMPDSPLTVGQAQTLLQMLNPANTPAFANIPDPNRPITYALWVELYKQLLEGLSGGSTIYEAFGIRAVDIIVLATSANSPLPEGRLISDGGPLGHGGLTMDGYIDRQLRVLVKDREIVALDALVSDRPTLKNAYVVDTDNAGVTVFSGGAERFFYWTEGWPEGSMHVCGVADVVIYNGRALAVRPLTESITGTILRVSDNFIEIKGLGLFPLDSDQFRVYDISDGPVRFRGRADLIVGTDLASFYLRDGVVGAGVIEYEGFPEMIRVVIGTSGFTGLVHNSVTVTSTGDFWVTAGPSDGGERIIELSAGQRFTVSDIENTDLLGHSRLFFHTGPEDKLQLTGLGRSWPQNASPRYRGVIEIAREPGGYSIVNVLCLEEYLYAVVPSEMPSSYGLTAAKVQAVTARSFAVYQILANRFHAMGGNIDDSVISQVYNNIPENEVSIEAVEATRGLVLWYGDDVVRANFFSTSSGMTANAGEVWGGVTPSFLRAQPQTLNTDGTPDLFDLSNEFRAARFLRNWEVEAYDSHSPWFRWRGEMSREELTAAVNARYEQDEIGNIIRMQVIRRGTGGNIMELLIIGETGEATVAGDLNIRSLLRPARLHRHDGSTLHNQAMMPSSFFVFDIGEETVVFYGGGHGHGVGMSQNGVRGMVNRGYTFEEILGHFYPGAWVSEF